VLKEGESMHLEERQKRILAAVVQEYVLTGEPVGSRTIARRYNLGVSPATIRNEMADLEEMGFLEQPHTSAGRIPSDYGYRYYVDHLMEPQGLSPEEQEHIRRRFQQRVLAIEQLLEETARLLSEITPYTAMALEPNPSRAKIEEVQIMPLAVPHRALLVVVTEGGMVEHRVLTLPPSIYEEDLEKISEALNSVLKGCSLDDLKELKAQVLKEMAKTGEYKDLLGEVGLLLHHLLFLVGNEKVYLEGVFNILEQPEFRDLSRLKELLAFLDQEEALRRLLKAPPRRGLTIRIGQENREEGIDRCSVITISYGVEGKIYGKVGLLGPTRMHYARVISVLQYVAQSLSQVLAQFYG